MSTAVAIAPAALTSRSQSGREVSAAKVVSTRVHAADTTFNAVARALTGIRLGKHERRILLLSPSYEAGAALGGGAVIPASDTSRTTTEAHRRALRRLASADLIYAMREGVRHAVERPTRIPLAWVVADAGGPSGRMGPTTIVRLASNQQYWHTAALLTPLGAAMVEVLRPDIEAGRGIRWSAHAGAIAAVLPRHEAAEAAAWARSDARLQAITAALSRATR